MLPEREDCKGERDLWTGLFSVEYSNILSNSFCYMYSICTEICSTLKQTEEIEHSEIKFENYSTKYPGANHDSIQNLNFTLAQGKMLGVIGPVGAGKSTLLNIFLDETIHTGGSCQLTKVSHSLLNVYNGFIVNFNCTPRALDIRRICS